jgi:SMC interacting uncharacterized protein involved in chromosome segregation
MSVYKRVNLQKTEMRKMVQEIKTHSLGLEQHIQESHHQLKKKDQEIARRERKLKGALQKRKELADKSEELQQLQQKTINTIVGLEQTIDDLPLIGWNDVCLFVFSFNSF